MATDMTLPEPLFSAAHEVKINISQGCERGLAREVSETRSQLWRQQNHAAIKAWNDCVDERGLPLAEFRSF